MPRLAVALVAVAAVAWLGVMARDTRLLDRGGAAADRLGSPAQTRQALQDLEGARLLNPDRTPDIRRALVLWLGGHGAAARAVLDDVVRAEPDDLAAWTGLQWVTAGKDPHRQREALAQLRRLDPVNRRRPTHAP